MGAGVMTRLTAASMKRLGDRQTTPSSAIEMTLVAHYEIRRKQ